MNTSLGYLLRSGKNSKMFYFARQGLRWLLPRAIVQRRLGRVLYEPLSPEQKAYVEDRVDYCCRLSATTPLPADSPTLGEHRFRGRHSAYFFDTYEFTRWFPDELKWRCLYGDITEVPSAPTIVKSRPIFEGGGNANSVLLNLDKCRHFVFLKDRIPFGKKANRVIFRGSVKSNPLRRRFVEMFRDDPDVDAADTVAGAGGAQQQGQTGLQPMISLYDHLHYKFIMAIEGNDVASNLKWIMSSHSIAVMPRPSYETWFMEGRLVPGFHYIEVKPDFSDLKEKIFWYAAHPAEAEAIVRHANAYVKQFRNPKRERLISLLVLKKYFERTGQELQLR